MQLSNEQIMLLEQLTYLTDEVASEAEVVLGPYSSVKDLLQQFTEEALRTLEQTGKVIGWVSAAKWAAIIRQIQSDPILYNMEISDKDDAIPALCFNDPSDPSRGIVVFRGTSGQDEWVDNGIGLGESDTECQKKALNYIEELPFDNITVAGHSKGGNKAQYVTILSDKVDRCISMDGQGFTQEFIDKYYAEIRKKADCITSYYLDGDFVSILMFPIPGANQFCIKSEQDVIGAENHCAPSFYHYFQDEEGRWHILLDDRGQTDLIEGPREESMVYLHEFTTFIVNVMPEKERDKAGEYIGYLLALIMVENAHFNLDGKEYTHNNVTEYMLSDPEMLAKVLAYFIKYAETYNLTEDQIRSLADVMGFNELLDKVDDIVKKYDSTMEKVISDAGGILNLLINQLKDGKDDPIIEWLLGFGNDWAAEKLGTEIDLGDLWRRLEAEYESIPDFDEKTAKNDSKCREDRIRDFSEYTFGVLMSTISSIEEDTFGSLAGWGQYSGEEWYESMLIPNAMSGIADYFEKISEISRICKIRVDNVYEQAAEADKRNARALMCLTENIRTLRGKIEEKTMKLQN